MELTETQQDFVLEVRDLYSTGLTQEKVAERLGKSVSTLRSRMRYYGIKFARNGKLVKLDGSPLDLDCN